MAYIKVNNDKVTPEIAKALIDLCPFNAFEYTDMYLSINASCKICKMCVKRGPNGVCELVETVKPCVDKSKYKGIAVYVEQRNNIAHPVSWELLGKARELSLITKEPVFAIIIGSDVKHMVNEALSYGADHVFAYENEAYTDFDVQVYTNVVEHFFKTHQNNVILFGSTPLGRSFAPRIAARLKTGLTADCTMLDIKPDGDLLQIRPAFGGNIMAKINTPNHRPQLATIRYKMFNLPEKVTPFGKVSYEDTKEIPHERKTRLIQATEKPKVKDISEAEVIIAVGRAFKKEKDLELIQPLVQKLNAEVACTRPLIENGWFDAKHQIGLSGRTVKPKLIINLGISGAVQYIEGMKEAELIISVNQDEHNKLFDISHYSIVGNIYDVLPELNKLIDQVWKVNA
ncbi:MAG: electron transfer flavoprotein subunit alpha [Tenericutes bacterium GWC2_34_14]|nr:MAG: electron transfer flavoprotein subunit alpha [Tenericutes bacterium GWA2_35_7]OHE28781.1 MAG: electron transfer flavoprotein subunit alpha [Tenericutes bacterium GWC2_34_14]OHE33249.1 MAG: electron transfer flavoprotein subunit alpha [Tenericutes bacterium GWE2_34_108]OHE36399.1 MAG: electron transfer flavoprotein subunit alpha [Tenericutes bacterium GWF1_35_14]OHE37603.1 MAG: electron transfer flavoprotein subunit alpha [Tenericutes bacterium GWF2_35_184]OHE45120.1 MAG: electron trans